MNFTTDLPKKDPLVSYIVASAVKCEKFFPNCNTDGPVYRMHAVILKKRHPKLQLSPVSPQNHSASSQENDNNQDVSNPVYSDLFYLGHGQQATVASLFAWPSAETVRKNEGGNRSRFSLKCSPNCYKGEHQLQKLHFMPHPQSRRERRRRRRRRAVNIKGC